MIGVRGAPYAIYNEPLSNLPVLMLMKIFLVGLRLFRIRAGSQRNQLYD